MTTINNPAFTRKARKTTGALRQQMHSLREAALRQQTQGLLRIRRTVNCIDGRVVVWKSEDRELGYEGSGVWKLDESGRSESSGGSGKRKRGEVTATLHEHWRCSSSDDSGVGAAYWTNEPRPSEPN